MNLLISYGTRPEYIKLLPLLKELKDNISFKTLYTGQHQDLIPEHSPNYALNSVKSKLVNNRLDSIVIDILSYPMLFKGYTHVMVQGDTTSAFAIALAAFHKKIPVIHLEAGLRTYENIPYPEEFNRGAISKIATTHLCPTKLNYENLIREGINRENIYITGNTVIDNIKHIKPSQSNIVIVTMHRRENHSMLPEYFKELSKIATEHSELSFVIPLHPNPHVQKCKRYLKNITIVAPVTYDTFIKQLAACNLIITDSGGLQEEGSFFGKQIIVCRDSTERPETLGTHSFLCKNPSQLSAIFHEIYLKPAPEAGNSPYGDGNAAKKIRSILESL